MSAHGADPASRLVSTMLDVVVAEQAEPGRLRRGRQYARQGAVASLIVEPGVVSGVVQGSRAEPYLATARVTVVQPEGPRMAALVPGRRDLRYTCTCPDDDIPCKHAVAVMAEFSERLARDGALFLQWRTGTVPEDGVTRTYGTGRGSSPDSAGPDGAALDDAGRAALALFVSEGLDPIGAPPTPTRLPDPVAAWDEVWAEMLTDALDALDRPVPPSLRRR